MRALIVAVFDDDTPMPQPRGFAFPGRRIRGRFAKIAGSIGGTASIFLESPNRREVLTSSNRGIGFSASCNKLYRVPSRVVSRDIKCLALSPSSGELFSGRSFFYARYARSSLPRGKFRSFGGREHLRREDLRSLETFSRNRRETPGRSFIASRGI